MKIRKIIIAALAVSAVCFMGLVSAYAGLDSNGESENILSNGSFEEGVYSPTALPDDWDWDAWLPSAIPTWDDTQARSGDKSVQIYSPTPNDAR